MSLHRKHLRFRALSLAIFIFILTAAVQFTHTCTSDEQSIFQFAIGFSFANETYTSRADSKPCIACIIIQTFNTAQIALVILLLFFVNIIRLCRLVSTDLHPRIFFSLRYIRGPPFAFRFI